MHPMSLYNCKDMTQESSLVAENELVPQVPATIVKDMVEGEERVWEVRVLTGPISRWLGNIDEERYDRVN